MRDPVHVPTHPRPAAWLLALCMAACAPTAQRAAQRPAVVPHSAAPRAFEWPGSYALTGQGFADGARHAALTVERADTTYRLTLAGPPGQPLLTHVVRDSAHVLWDFGEGGEPMYVALRGAGDSLVGRWARGAGGGPIRGRRTP